MPTIKRITAEPYNIPLKGSLKWGKGHELKHLEHALIRVELSDSSVGIAEATPRPTIYGETQVSVLHIIEHHLAPMLIGEGVQPFRKMELIKGNNTAKGALDMAITYAQAKSANMRLTEKLVTTRSKIQVSYIVSTGTTDDVIADVESAYEAGVRVFKVKIGKDIPQETETIKQLIKQFADAEFYVDANQTLTIHDAADILNELYDLGVIHCEEALPIHKIIERIKLREQTKMPIIADDSAFTIYDLQRECSLDTFDILNIKTPRTGFTASEMMLSYARMNNKKIMIGSQASSLLGCLYAAIFSAQDGVDCANEVSFFLKTDVDLSDPPSIVDGYMSLDDVQTSLDNIISDKV